MTWKELKRVVKGMGIQEETEVLSINLETPQQRLAFHQSPGLPFGAGVAGPQPGIVVAQPADRKLES